MVNKIELLDKIKLFLFIKHFIKNANQTWNIFSNCFWQNSEPTTSRVEHYLHILGDFQLSNGWHRLFILNPTIPSEKIKYFTFWLVINRVFAGIWFFLLFLRQLLLLIKSFDLEINNWRLLSCSNWFSNFFQLTAVIVNHQQISFDFSFLREVRIVNVGC